MTYIYDFSVVSRELYCVRREGEKWKIQWHDTDCNRPLSLFVYCSAACQCSTTCEHVSVHVPFYTDTGKQPALIMGLGEQWHSESPSPVLTPLVSGRPGEASSRWVNTSGLSGRARATSESSRLPLNTLAQSSEYTGGSWAKAENGLSEAGPLQQSSMPCEASLLTYCCSLIWVWSRSRNVQRPTTGDDRTVLFQHCASDIISYTSNTNKERGSCGRGIKRHSAHSTWVTGVWNTWENTVTDEEVVHACGAIPSLLSKHVFFSHPQSDDRSTCLILKVYNTALRHPICLRSRHRARPDNTLWCSGKTVGD